MTTELVEVEKKAVSTMNESSPIAIMQMALAQGADISKLESMMALQERWEKNEARKAYHQAMADFKANPPRINKDKTVAYSGTKYTHASLGNVTELINAGLGEHGLTASWKTDQANGLITVLCSITHKLGHSEATGLTSPPDTSGKKNSIQAMGSAISYLQRYTLLSLTGLATHDMDDDAQRAAVAMVDEKQKSQIVDMMTAAEVDQGDFLKYLKVDAVEKIPANMVSRVMSDLNAVIARKEGDA